MKKQTHESDARFPFWWLDNPVGMALLAMVWSINDPFGDEQRMD